MKAKLCAFAKTRMFHVLVLLAGLAFLLTGAFHGNVWFDESYSVAIANHLFADIWDIGSGDVHPVLFYWGLHVLNLLFGQNILAYRLFTVAGTFSLALLGLLVVRRDFGQRIGVLFSFLVLFMPYIAFMAVEIRMYSWASFTVAGCFLFAWRIACALAGAGKAESGRAKKDGVWWSRMWQVHDIEGLPRWAGAPRRWWLAFFAFSLASAYLHYYGVLAAFLTNLGMLAFIAMRKRSALVPFLIGAVVQVALYAPWLAVVANQVGVVSGSYWADVEFPRTLVEWAFYPIATSQVIFADTYGWQWVVALGVCAAVAIVSAAGGIYTAWRRGAFQHAAYSSLGIRKRVSAWAVSPEVLPALCGVALYVGVFAIALIASFAMGSLIVYYRYLSVTIGPLVLALAVAVSRIKSKACVSGLLVAFLGTALVSQALFLQDAYNEKNQVPLQCFQEEVWEHDAPLVLSSDIGIEGVTAVSCTDIPQTFFAWQPGNWAHAYQSYAPTLSTVASWDEALKGYSGTFVVLGQTSKEGIPVDVSDLEKRSDVQLKETHTFYRPYERTWFTIAVMQRDLDE